MALNTGMRRGEILNLKWSDINMRTGTIIIRKSKNNEVRMIPINDTLKQSLEQIGPQQSNEYVFGNGNGKPYVTIKTGFKAAVRRAGITDFRFHDLRHTFASHLIMSGVDIKSVQELLGHKDIRMTIRYSHLSNAHLQEAVKRLDVDRNAVHMYEGTNIGNNEHQR
jgi:integrase